MEWDNVTSLALIEQYKHQPILWNTRHNNHYSKKKRQQAWETIAANMGLVEEDVRQKIGSLLGSFRRLRSKMKRENYSPRWFAFESMRFLLNRHEDLEEDKIYLEQLQPVKFEEDEDLSLDNDSNHLLEEELNESSQDFKLGHVEEEERQLQSPTEAPMAKKMKTKRYNSPKVDDLSIFPTQDESATYGQYVASKLRKYSDRTRSMVEHAINNILFEADLGKYDNLPCPVDTSQRTTSTTASFFNTNLDGINLFPPMADSEELAQLPQQSTDGKTTAE